MGQNAAHQPQLGTLPATPFQPGIRFIQPQRMLQQEQQEQENRNVFPLGEPQNQPLNGEAALGGGMGMLPIHHTAHQFHRHPEQQQQPQQPQPLPNGANSINRWMVVRNDPQHGHHHHHQPHHHHHHAQPTPPPTLPVLQQITREDGNTNSSASGQRAFYEPQRAYAPFANPQQQQQTNQTPAASEETDDIHSWYAGVSRAME